MDYISTDFVHITFWTLFASLLALQILDIHSTHTALTTVTKIGHKLVEGNPFVQGAMERFGIIGGMVITKLPFVLLMGVFLNPHWIHLSLIHISEPTRPY